MRTKKFSRKKKKRIKEKKKCRNSKNVNVRVETASSEGLKYEIFILLPQLVFVQERLEPPISFLVFWLGNPYHVLDCSQNLHKR